MRIGKCLTGLSLIAICLATPLASLGQEAAYPVKPLRLIVPSTPGSAFELNGRLLATKMGEAMGQPFVTENRAGASGMIGTEAVARAAPDGYTMLWATPAFLVTTVFMIKKLPFDPRKDFEPISDGAEPITMQILHPSVPAANVTQFIEYAKKNPGKLSYGHTGIGTAFHLMGETFNFLAGTTIVNVPYKGPPQSLQDLVAGRIQTMWTTIGSGMPLYKSGKIKIIAVNNAVRHPALPDVPVATEALPGWNVPLSWYAMFAPAGTPRPIQQRLQSELVAAIKTPESRAWLATNYHNPGGKPLDEFKAEYHKSFDVWGTVVMRAGVVPE